MESFLKNDIINHYLQDAQLALFLDPDTEVSGPSYTRQPITFAPPTDGVTVNLNHIFFPVATSRWGLVTHAAVTSLSDLLYLGPLKAPVMIVIGGRIDFPVHSIKVRNK